MTDTIIKPASQPDIIAAWFSVQNQTTLCYHRNMKRSEQDMRPDLDTIADRNETVSLMGPPPVPSASRFTGMINDISVEFAARLPISCRGFSRTEGISIDR